MTNQLINHHPKLQWWKKNSCTSWYGNIYPMIYDGLLYMPGGCLEFPSTASCSQPNLTEIIIKETIMFPSILLASISTFQLLTSENLPKKRSFRFVLVQVVTTTPTPTSRVLRGVSMAPWALPWRSSSLRYPGYEKLDHRGLCLGETHIHWKLLPKYEVGRKRRSMIYCIHVPGMNWYSVHPPPKKKQNPSIFKSIHNISSLEAPQILPPLDPPLRLPTTLPRNRGC